MSTEGSGRRERLVLVAAVAVVLLAAWAWLIAGAGMDMNAVEMTAMAGMDGWLMQPAIWTAAYALLIFGMWWTMMVAMMLPSATPMLLLHARVMRGTQVTNATSTSTALFAAGYLLAWGGFSLLATATQWGLEAAQVLSPMLETSNRWLGAGILLAAGIWQLTPLKASCLRHCRSPLSFLVGHWRDGRLGALRMGLEHGVFCLGCCWFLMLLLFFGGVMNLYWIVGLAVFVLLEKTVPRGHWFGRVAGVALIGCAVALVAGPG